ncbi:dihydroorotase [Methanocella arvoryzae]|uniref:Dihydroorotase n=1 Tax=Methanocella arvoryzae (strain DSM 22066 / NBRC 105507 / MRE50) TaxID=351160 RepID=Q0W790_METAR|nr:dihydroorotase [Methanocella arvoryzae]CAJ35753.1 dihydroorotase [Methanocella arvoryzae MRE50]
MHELVVEDAMVSFDGEILACSIGIDEGKITRIAKVLKGEEKYDARGRLVMPGVIDSHVHFRDMRQEEKEDWLSGSKAALYGGVTTVVDMPNSDPPTFDAEAFKVKQTVAANRSMVDFSLNAGVGDNLPQLPQLWKLGALAFGEIFMAKSTGGFSIDEPALKEALKAITLMGATASIHAEDEALHEELKKSLKHDPSSSIHSKLRPRESEINAVEAAIRLARETRVAMHITHISTSRAVELISREGITCDVTPHHLLLTMDHWDRLGSHAKMNPPIRHDSDRNALWKAVNDGSIEVLASDHAPHTLDEKNLPVREAPSGVPGVETMLPLMLKAVADKRLPLQRLIDMTSANPARIFGIEGKGSFAAGNDADMVFVDMAKVRQITPAGLHSKAGWTPYRGFEAIFPEAVMLRGDIVLDGKDFYAKRGTGKFIPGKGYKRLSDVLKMARAGKRT